MSTRRRPSSAELAIEPTLRRPGAQLGPRARRTIDRILAATKTVFLAQGYGATSIDDIAQEAGISRASFYTYFPSKRDALLALGTDATQGAEALIDDLAGLGPDWDAPAIEEWVERYFEFLDDYGSFVLAWAQAAFEDHELRRAGMKRHLRTCRRLGEALEKLRGQPRGDARSQGLAVFSMLERTWAQCRLYGDAVEPATVRDNAALVIIGTLAER